MAPQKNTNTLERIKFRRKLTLIGTVCILVALILYGILRPDPEEVKINEIKDMILDRKFGKMSSEDRKSVRDIMTKLSPKTRERVSKEVMRAMLQKFREDTASMSLEEKKKKIDVTVKKMRKRFLKMSDEKLNKMRKRVTSQEGKKRMKTALGFYYSDFSPEERKLMDPMVHEWTIEMNMLEKRRKKH
jgi:hypothetical protein